MQIRRAYVAQIGAVHVSLQSETDMWILNITKDGRPLYSARRANAAAAKAVAAEFMAMIVGSAGPIRWTESW